MIFFQALVTNVPDIIKTIISWTMDYLQEHLVNWIREQGGWVSKPTFSLLFLNVCGCYDFVLIIIIYSFFKGRHTLLLWHTNMADNRGFLGWCPHYCSRHSQDVRGL